MFLTNEHSFFLLVFILSFVAQQGYYLYFYLPFIFSAKSNTVNNKISLLNDSVFSPKISVLICARNESENLQKYLKFVLNQSYNNFEVIVVNDRSNDDTQKVLEEYKKQTSFIISNENIEKNENLSKLKLLNIFPNETNADGKKYAFEKGIELCDSDWILTTDADCFVGKNWISTYLKYISTDVAMVAGYAPFFRNRNTFVENLSCYENMFNSLFYMSLINKGIPYMAVGRNMMFNKIIYQNNKQKIKGKHIQSGDDDLFANAISKSYRFAVNTDKDSFVYSESKSTFGDWWRQRKRHLSASVYYHWTHIFIISSEFFSRIFLIGSFFVYLLHTKEVFICSIVLIFRMITQLVCFILVEKLFNEKKIKLKNLYDILLPFLYGALHFSNFFFKKQRWK